MHTVIHGSKTKDSKSYTKSVPFPLGLPISLHGSSNHASITLKTCENQCHRQMLSHKSPLSPIRCIVLSSTAKDLTISRFLDNQVVARLATHWTMWPYMDITPHTRIDSSWLPVEGERGRCARRGFPEVLAGCERCDIQSGCAFDGPGVRKCEGPGGWTRLGVQTSFHSGATL